MMAIKAAIDAKGEGETRRTVLVPESAHGTNPATAALIGFKVRNRACRYGWDRARAGGEGSDRAGYGGDHAHQSQYLRPVRAGDRRDREGASRCGGVFSIATGRIFNAIVGKARPGDLGVDAMHINLHKTFSTPHGGGGPGSGPVVLSQRLAPFAPVPFVTPGAEEGLTLVEHEKDADEKPFGRITAFHGQMGMYVRALAYMLSHGSDGMKQASEDAVLNANYIRAGLRDLMSQPFGDKPCMHEALFDDSWLKDTGVSTLDFAKAMIDEGYHPMTVYFPLVAHGAMLVEPTESESKSSLDLFIASMRDLAQAAKRGESERFAQAPFHAPRRRLDETRAAPPADPEMDAAGANARGRRVRRQQPARNQERPRMIRAVRVSGLRPQLRRPASIGSVIRPL